MVTLPPPACSRKSCLLADVSALVRSGRRTDSAAPMPLNSSSSSDNSSTSAFSSKLSPAVDLCVGLSILSVVLLSVLGNGLVLVICYRRRQKMAGSELLCINLAVVDFLCCICFYPLSIASSFRHAWLGAQVACVYYGLGCFAFGLCSMFTVTAISITRYMKTCYRLSHSVWLKAPNIRALCCAIWLLSALWSGLPLLGWGEYAPEPYGLSCTVAWRGYHTSAKDAFYVICSFAGFTLVPVLVIVASQCTILYRVSRFSCELSARGIRNNLRRAEKRISMMFFCISLGFVMAWAPYAVVSFLYIFHSEPRYMAPEGFVLPALFAKSSHVYNPFIYFYFNKTFRQELRCLLQAAYLRLTGNRVGVHVSTAQQQQRQQHPPHPIHIQLQERGRIQKSPFAFPQDSRCVGRGTRSSSSSSGGGSGSSVGGRVRCRQMFACWGSTSRNTEVVLDEKPNKDYQVVYI